MMAGQWMVVIIHGARADGEIGRLAALAYLRLRLRSAGRFGGKSSVPAGFWVSLLKTRSRGSRRVIPIPKRGDGPRTGQRGAGPAKPRGAGTM
jgi:hypothetical protein